MCEQLSVMFKDLKNCSFHAACSQFADDRIKGVLMRDDGERIVFVYLVEDTGIEDKQGAIDVCEAAGVSVYRDQNDYDHSPTGLWFNDGVWSHDVQHLSILGVWAVPVSRSLDC